MNKDEIKGTLKYISTCIDNIADGLEDAKKIVNSDYLEDFYLHMAKNLRTQVTHINNLIKGINAK